MMERQRNDDEDCPREELDQVHFQLSFQLHCFLERIRIVQSNSGAAHHNIMEALARGLFQSAVHRTGFLDLQCRHMSKFLSKSATKRLPLNTKRARKSFYKGKGATKEGHLTSKNRFIVDHSRRLQLVVPDLTGFKLKPYIASTASKFPPETRRNPTGLS